MGKFRVIDLRSGVIEPEHIVDAPSPELAALQALGEKGVRGGQNRTRLFCRVYWQDSAGQPTWSGYTVRSGWKLNLRPLDDVVSTA